MSEEEPIEWYEGRALVHDAGGVTIMVLPDGSQTSYSYQDENHFVAVIADYEEGAGQVEMNMGDHTDLKVTRDSWRFPGMIPDNDTLFVVAGLGNDSNDEPWPGIEIELTYTAARKLVNQLTAALLSEDE